MPTPSKRKSPAKTPPHKSVSKELYEKERAKANDFVAFMTSPSPSKSSVGSLRSKSASPSPSRRFAKGPAKTYSARDRSPLQKSKAQDTTTDTDAIIADDEEDENSVVPFLAIDTPTKLTPLWTDLEVAKSPAELMKLSAQKKAAAANKKQRSRGLSPNSHGRAIARSLSTPNTIKLVDEIVGRYNNNNVSPRKRSSAEDALSNAHNKRGAHSSPRGKFHKASVLTGGPVCRMIPTGSSPEKKRRALYSPLRHTSILMNRESLPDLKIVRENVTELKSNAVKQKAKEAVDDKSKADDSKVPSTARGRRSCPPKFYHDEVVDRKDRESPSRIDSPSYGLLPVKREKKSDVQSKKSAMNAVEKEQVDVKPAAGDSAADDSTAREQSAIIKSELATTTTKTEDNTDSSNNGGKKRRRSRARRHITAGFSLGNIEQLENALKTPKEEPADTTTSDESGKQKRRTIKKEILSNKELEEMMSKKRKQSAERKKKAAAKKEAAKLAAEELEAALALQESGGGTLSIDEKANPPKEQNNLIVRLLTDSPSAGEEDSDGKKLSKRDALIDEHINRYTSSGNTAAIKRDAKGKIQSTNKGFADKKSANVRSGLKELTVNEAQNSENEVDAAGNDEQQVQLAEKEPVPELSAAKDQKQVLADEKQTTTMAKNAGHQSTTDTSQPPSEPSAESSSSKRLEGTNTSPSKRTSSQSPGRAQLQAASSLEKVHALKTTPESHGGRAKRQAASSLEMFASPESPLRAKRLLAALHDDVPSPIDRTAAPESSELVKDVEDKKISEAPNNEVEEKDKVKEVAAMTENSLKNQSEERTLMADDDAATTEVVASENSQVAKESINTTVDNDETQSTKTGETIDTKKAMSKATPADIEVKTTQSDQLAENDVQKIVEGQTSDPTNATISQSPVGVPIVPRQVFDAIHRLAPVQEQASGSAALVHVAPHVHLVQATANSQAPSFLKRGQMCNDQLRFEQMMVDSQYQNAIGEYGNTVAEFNASNERLRQLQHEMLEVDAGLAPLRRGDGFGSPFHNESVSRTYHSEIISFKRRRYRPSHHLDVDDYTDRRHYSSRHRCGLRDERRLSRSQRRGRKSRRRERRHSDEDSIDESDEEFQSSRNDRKRPKSKVHRSIRNDDFCNDSESEQSPMTSRKMLRQRDQHRSREERDFNDKSDAGVNDSRRERLTVKDKPRKKRNDDSNSDEAGSVDSHHGSAARSSKLKKKEKNHSHDDSSNRGRMESPGIRSKYNRHESPRRGARQTNSILESVSPVRTNVSSLESPRRAKSSQSSVLKDESSQSSVLKNVGNNVDSQKEESHASNANAHSNNSIDSRLSNNMSETKDSEDTKKETSGGQSYWLSADYSDSDWEGPMILPPPPI